MTGITTAPLTPTQRDLFLDALRHPEDAAFNVAVSVSLPSRVEPGRWKQALGKVVAGQDINRTVFALRDGQPCQVVSADMPAVFVNRYCPDWDDAAVRTFVEQTMAVPMDCGTGPLAKYFLIQKNSGDVAAVVASHLVMDRLTGVLLHEAV